MWNTAFKEHQSQHPNCKSFIYWDPKEEEKRGIGWIEWAEGNICNYTSRKFKLYEEIEPPTKRPGRKVAKVNLGMQIGRMHTPVVNSALSQLMLSANIPAPSTKGLQNSGKLVNAQVQQ